MSRGYLNFKALEKRLNVIWKDDELSQNDFERIFKDRRDSKVFNLAARLVRFFAKDVNKFRDVYNCSTNPLTFNKLFDGKPLIILGSKPTTLRVFQNLVIDKTDHDEMRNCCWFMSFDCLETFFKDYQEDMKNEAKAKSWETLRRSMRRISRSVEVDTATALTRYANVEGLSSAQIRDIAAGIEESRLPLELIYADTLEKTVEMYASGPASCMSWTKPNSENGNSRHWAFMPEEMGVHPTAYFLHHPYTKGVYCKSKGVVSARAILYEVKDGVWEYGRVYASNPKIQQAFINALTETGVKGALSTGHFTRNAEFRVKGYKFPEHLGKAAVLMPVPYFDNMVNYDFKFDKATQEFICYTGSKYSPTYSAGTGGYLASNVLNKVDCACGGLRSVRADQLTPSQDGQHFFCGNSSCFATVGYVQATRSDGNSVVVPKSEAIFDAPAKRYYTNEEALKARGGLPYLKNISMDGLDMMPEDEDMTTAGVIALIDGKQIRVLSDTNISRLYARYAEKNLGIKHVRIKQMPKIGAVYEIINPVKSERINTVIKKVRTVILENA